MTPLVSSPAALALPPLDTTAPHSCLSPNLGLFPPDSAPIWASWPRLRPGVLSCPPRLPVTSSFSPFGCSQIYCVLFLVPLGVALVIPVPCLRALILSFSLSLCRLSHPCPPECPGAWPSQPSGHPVSSSQGVYRAVPAAYLQFLSTLAHFPRLLPGALLLPSPPPPVVSTVFLWPTPPSLPGSLPPLQGEVTWLPLDLPGDGGEQGCSAPA